MQELNEAAINYLAKKIKEKVFEPVISNRTTVFLCGAALDDKSALRGKLGSYLSSAYNKLDIQLHYPEDLFEELLFSSKGNLLSLEGLLAESVDAIVIIPESPGSFAELGAFANDENLRKKIVCLVDSKYKKDKSFINQGPLRLVKAATNPGIGILYYDITKVEDTFKKLYKLLLKKRGSSKQSELTLLQLEGFLLPSIFLLEPISKQSLICLVQSATKQADLAELATVRSIS